QVGKSTLGDQIKGKHKPIWDFHQSRHALTPEQEQVVADWATLRAYLAMPMDTHDIWAHAQDVSNIDVGPKWFRGFSRHPELVMKRPVKLDPK
ncbi:hypothetical protein P691DRAFT_664375, partial [Macrolepiota fuliginosa MF-IS2]